MKTSVEKNARLGGPELFTLPAIDPTLRFGVLRSAFSGRSNSASGFVWSKLHPTKQRPPAIDLAPSPWEPTASRVDVILPAQAADAFTDPRVLILGFEAQKPKNQLDLLIAVKLCIEPGQPLHVGWERARGFAVEAFAERGLAAILVLHDPSRTGSRTPNDPHVHVMVPAMVIGAGGLRGPTELACDEGQEILVEAWRK